MDQHCDLSKSCSIEFFPNVNTKRSLFLKKKIKILERAQNRSAHMKSVGELLFKKCRPDISSRPNKFYNPLFFLC